MWCSYSYLVASILTFLTLQGVVAFVINPAKVLPKQRRQQRQQQQQSNRLCSTVRHLASRPYDEHDVVDDGDGEEDDFDEYLRQSLERAKNDKLGAPIPPELKRQRAKRVESEFLEAMRNVSEEFSRLKKELGSDGAVNKFLEQIDDEDVRIQDDDLDSIFQ